MTIYKEGQFEQLRHTVFGGEKHDVPLYVRAPGGLVEESNTLLRAADIIGGNMHLFGGEIKNLKTTIDYLVSAANDNPREAIIISDSDGAGAISVNQRETVVSIHGVGSWAIESDLFATMVRQWAQYEEGQNSSG